MQLIMNLLHYVFFFDNVYPDKRKDPPNVVKTFNQAFHKRVLAGAEQEWQGQGIRRDGN
jgi:hypothetical protein